MSLVKFLLMHAVHKVVYTDLTRHSYHNCVFVFVYRRMVQCYHYSYLFPEVFKCMFLWNQGISEFPSWIEVIKTLKESVLLASSGYIYLNFNLWILLWNCPLSYYSTFLIHIVSYFKKKTRYIFFKPFYFDLETLFTSFRGMHLSDFFFMTRMSLSHSHSFS